VLAPSIPKVDIMSPAISHALSSLAALQKDSEQELLVRISAPIHVHMIPSITTVKSLTTKEDGIIEDFMSSWTHLVGNPNLSKWIILILGVSIALNGYLLKGISTGTGFTCHVQPPQDVRFTSNENEMERESPIISAFPEVRVEKVITASIKPVRPVPPIRRSISTMLDSINEKLKAQKFTKKPDLTPLSREPARRNQPSESVLWKSALTSTKMVPALLRFHSLCSTTRRLFCWRRMARSLPILWRRSLVIWSELS